MKNYRKKKPYLNLILFVIVLFLLLPNVAFPVMENAKIDVFDNKMTVDLQHVSIVSVLDKINKKTGIKYVIGEELSDKKISITFQSLPIDIALHRILNHFNCSIIFGPDHEIQKVLIFGLKHGTMISTNKLPISNSLTLSPMIVRNRPVSSMKSSVRPVNSMRVNDQPTVTMEVTKHPNTQMEISGQPILPMEITKYPTIPMEIRTKAQKNMR